MAKQKNIWKFNDEEWKVHVTDIELFEQTKKKFDLGNSFREDSVGASWLHIEDALGRMLKQLLGYHTVHPSLNRYHILVFDQNRILTSRSHEDALFHF